MNQVIYAFTNKFEKNEAEQFYEDITNQNFENMTIINKTSGVQPGI